MFGAGQRFMIHPSTIIDDLAQLDENVRVGPYSVIGAEVEIVPLSLINRPLASSRKAAYSLSS